MENSSLTCRPPGIIAGHEKCCLMGKVVPRCNFPELKQLWWRLAQAAQVGVWMGAGGGRAEQAHPVNPP